MRIVRGQTTLVALTLNEKRQESNSEFIIEFIHRLTGASKVVGVTDVSDYKDRANQFNITESNTENLSHSVVKLYPPDQWDYTVYEMEVSSPRNLDPDDAIKIVERGVCIVVESTAGSVTTFSEEETKNSPSFNEP